MQGRWELQSVPALSRRESYLLGKYDSNYCVFQSAYRTDLYLADNYVISERMGCAAAVSRGFCCSLCD